jgi:hypothetical protein
VRSGQRLNERFGKFGFERRTHDRNGAGKLVEIEAHQRAQESRDAGEPAVDPVRCLLPIVRRPD